MKNDQKRAAAQAAIGFIQEDMIIGVGTGSTVDYFIQALAAVKYKVQAAVPSSARTEQALKAAGILTIDLNSAPSVPLYVDGADEVNHHLQAIKGGGGALTQEKIIAAASQRFICIVDQHKTVQRLGQFPVPIEVIPMARSYVAREIVKLGGDPVYREHFKTDNGNIILDVHHLVINEPIKMEQTLNQIPGVVTNGIFAQNPADLLLVGTDSGVEERTARG